jgi:hypothetical protein
MYNFNNSFTARMCAIWRSDLEVQADLENDVITSITVSLRACARFPGLT